MYVKFTEACGHIYNDQTGQFLVQYSNGYKYLSIFCGVDSNTIILRPLKIRDRCEIMNNILEVITLLISQECHPKFYHLDNKITNNLKTLLKSAFVNFQLVPSHNHQQNAAQRAIQAWKAHLISTLCTVDWLSILHIWCRLLVQIDLTLNHMRASNLHPQLSAYHALLGQFNFNKTPIITLGTHAIIHKTSCQQKSFGVKRIEGWYVGPVLKHYCCQDIFLRKKMTQEVVRRLNLHNYKIPIPNLQDYAIIVAKKTYWDTPLSNQNHCALLIAQTALHSNNLHLSLPTCKHQITNPLDKKSFCCTTTFFPLQYQHSIFAIHHHQLRGCQLKSQHHFWGCKPKLHSCRLPSNQKINCATSAHHYTTTKFCTPSKKNNMFTYNGEHVQTC